MSFRPKAGIVKVISPTLDFEILFIPFMPVITNSKFVCKVKKLCSRINSDYLITHYHVSHLSNIGWKVSQKFIAAEDVNFLTQRAGVTNSCPSSTSNRFHLDLGSCNEYLSSINNVVVTLDVRFLR